MVWSTQDLTEDSILTPLLLFFFLSFSLHFPLYIFFPFLYFSLFPLFPSFLSFSFPSFLYFFLFLSTTITAVPSFSFSLTLPFFPSLLISFLLSYFLTFLQFLPSPPLPFLSFFLSDLLISPSPLSFPFPPVPLSPFLPLSVHFSPSLSLFHFPKRRPRFRNPTTPLLTPPHAGLPPTPPLFHSTNPHSTVPGPFPPPDPSVLPSGSEVSQESLLLHGPFARKPKRIRTAFSPSQLLRLERAFEKNHYVVGAERKQLASSLSLSETQVWRSHPHPIVRGLGAAGSTPRWRCAGPNARRFPRSSVWDPQRRVGVGMPRPRALISIVISSLPDASQTKLQWPKQRWRHPVARWNPSARCLCADPTGRLISAAAFGFEGRLGSFGVGNEGAQEGPESKRKSVGAKGKIGAACGRRAAAARCCGWRHP